MAENDEGRSAPGGWILGARRERDMATVGISFLYAGGGDARARGAPPAPPGDARRQLVLQYTQDLLMRAADAALHAAKELGRDRISTPPSDVAPLRPR